MAIVSYLKQQQHKSRNRNIAVKQWKKNKYMKMKNGGVGKDSDLNRYEEERRRNIYSWLDAFNTAEV